MPPKAKVNKKTEVKKKEKLIEDKTFGMKNKKSAKIHRPGREASSHWWQGEHMDSGRGFTIL